MVCYNNNFDYISAKKVTMKNIEGDHTKFKLLDYKSTGVSFAEYFSCNGVILNGFPDWGRESVESFIERPKMKEDMEWAIKTDQQLSTLE